ncbi:MAG: GNAT family N-acetyltransferase [Clostridia bacterium]|nr:GNAT family N-acetyltransferase [Clostridia bacterium]MBR6007799.1 GNAT family N-acetyltransferase [Clostridia bacterium]
MELKRVQISEKPKLYSLMQKYLHELTAYYPMEMDGNGDYAYQYLDLYFTEPERDAYFFIEGRETVGFCLINRHSVTQEQPDNCVAEFTVFPAYRNRGKGEAAFALLKKERKGSWQLKFSENNLAAAAFWRKIGRNYHGREQMLPDGETVLSFE